MNILLIDDDPVVLTQIRDSLHQSQIGIKCTTTTSCEQALEMLYIQKYDLILVDINFPATPMDGLSLIKTIRSSKMNIPIVVISGSAEIQSKIRALEFGADDYILKPFEKNELIARIKRHVFRNNHHSNNRFVVGPLTLDMETKVVTLKSEKEKKIYTLKLTNKEYQLLEILVFKKGITISKFLLLQQLYSGYSSNPDAKIIDVIMCKIRKKIANIIGNDETNKLIVTYWGRGYAIEDSNMDMNYNAYDSPSIFSCAPPLTNNYNYNNNPYHNNYDNNMTLYPKQQNKIVY